MLEYTLHDYVKLVLNDYFQKLGETPPSKVYDMVITEVEKALFKSVLDYCENNQSKTAQILGISRGTLRHKLKEYDLDIHARE
jgi:Fis family transcriptional regulator